MEYFTARFENTYEGLRQKDGYTRQVASQGYRIISEQIEQGHKGREQCCWALTCLPGIFLAGRTPGTIVVTYGREAFSEQTQNIPKVRCLLCNAQILADAKFCEYCGANLAVSRPLPEGMKTCPQCAEHIQVAAKRCRYCGAVLEGPASTEQENKSL
jgi:hypothetical protein